MSVARCKLGTAFLSALALMRSSSTQLSACTSSHARGFAEPLLEKRKKIVTGEEEAPPLPAGLEEETSGTAEEKLAEEGNKVRICCPASLPSGGVMRTLTTTRRHSFPRTKVAWGM